jgi:hypothetical protein
MAWPRTDTVLSGGRGGAGSPCAGSKLSMTSAVGLVFLTSCNPVLAGDSGRAPEAYAVGGTMTDLPLQSILTRLAEIERSGRLTGLEIEFWSGGGLPPPYYRSEQLRLATRGGRDIMEFAKLKWDESFDPPQLQEKWLYPLQPDQTSTVARLLLGSQALIRTYPEEQNPNIADILSHEIVLTANGSEVKRRYFRKEPDALGELRAAVNGLIDLTKKQGRYGLYHQGNEVPPSRPQ